MTISLINGHFVFCPRYRRVGLRFKELAIVECDKGASSVQLRAEFPRINAMPSLWTRSYFASTIDNVIKWYVDTQKTRP